MVQERICRYGHLANFSAGTSSPTFSRPTVQCLFPILSPNTLNSFSNVFLWNCSPSNSTNSVFPYLPASAIPSYLSDILSSCTYKTYHLRFSILLRGRQQFKAIRAWPVGIYLLSSSEFPVPSSANIVYERYVLAASIVYVISLKDLLLYAHLVRMYSWDFSSCAILPPST